MRKKVALIGVIVAVIGGVLRLLGPHWGLFTVARHTVTVGLIGDIIGFIGVMLVIYDLACNLRYS